jgi:acetolactate synthase-1/2/3 large subunit
MNMQELGTAMQYRAGIVVLVFNNGMWGTIRAHQEREFPARKLALGFDNPQFAELVTAYRGYGEVVEKDADFGPAFERARAFAEREQLPALLEIRYDPDGIAPGATLSGIRKAALDKRQNI